MNVRMQGRRRVAAIVAQTNVGSLEYDQFRTKKNDGPLYPLRGHNTRTLAGIFGVIGRFSCLTPSESVHSPIPLTSNVQRPKVPLVSCPARALLLRLLADVSPDCEHPTDVWIYRVKITTSMSGKPLNPPRSVLRRTHIAPYGHLWRIDDSGF